MENSSFSICMRKIIGEYKENYKDDNYELVKNAFHLIGYFNHGIINKVYEIIKEINSKDISYDQYGEILNFCNDDELKKSVSIFFIKEENSFEIYKNIEFYVDEDLSNQEEDEFLKSKLKNIKTIHYKYKSEIPNQLEEIYCDSTDQKDTSNFITIYTYDELGKLQTEEQAIDTTYYINYQIETYRILVDYYNLKMQQLYLDREEDIDKKNLANVYMEENDYFSMEQLFLDENGQYNYELYDELIIRLMEYDSNIAIYNEKINKYIIGKNALREKNNQEKREIYFKTTNYDENGNATTLTRKTIK